MDYVAVLQALAKQHEFFIGIDSDGCVFDSMEIKHKESFCPNFLLVWIGYDPTKGAAQLPRTMELMKTFYSAVPAAFFLLAFWVFYKYPISRRVATEVRAELDERRRAAMAEGRP